jgi:hypothetical protein
MFRLWHRSLVFAFTLAFLPLLLHAKKGIPERAEFMAPVNVQAVTLKNAISVSWEWKKPETLRVYKEIGFDVKRSDGKMFYTKVTAFQDNDLPPGAYSYSTRVRALVKEKGKSLYLVSDWSETVGGKIVAVCPGPPKIELSVIPTQKVYSSIPSLRFRLQGTVLMDKACTLSWAKYHLDTGRGIAHSGTLKVDKMGKYDAFVNALGPEDEIPTGVASFSVSVTAENESGPSTSDVYTLDVALQNPYAPR